jgi:hypothetical protein
VKILFGILASLVGLVFAVFNKRFSRANDASSKELFGRTGNRGFNRAMFVGVGVLMVVGGLLVAFDIL